MEDNFTSVVEGEPGAVLERGERLRLAGGGRDFPGECVQGG